MKDIFLKQNGHLLLSHADFNTTIGKSALAELRRKQYQCATTIPASGKIFIIGDLHEQVDILLDIFAHIQSNPENNLNTNPQNKIILLGDIITPTKSFLSSDTILGLAHANPDQLRGDIIVRAIITLISLYPNQIIPINGNHEIGFYIGTKLETNINMPYHPSLFQDVLSSHPIGSASIENYKFFAQAIELLPMIVFLQNKNRRYALMHSPGSLPMPTEQDLKQTKHILDWTTSKSNVFLNIFKGHGNINKTQDYAKALNANKIFFGHAAPDGLLLAITEKRWNKIDNNPGALGFNNKNGCFVDSQTRTIHSGYIILDFDNNKETVINMTNIVQQHPDSQLALQATQIPKPPNWSKKWQYIIRTLS